MRTLLLAALIVSGCGGRGAPVRLPAAALTFPDGKTITVELALTPADRERGLMFRTSLDPDYGMLFVFHSEQPMQHFRLKQEKFNPP